MWVQCTEFAVIDYSEYEIDSYNPTNECYHY